MKNIQEALLPLMIVLCVCGLAVFEYPLGRPRLYLTIIYILISWLLYIYNFYKILIIYKYLKIDNIPIAVKFSIFLTLTYTLFNLYYNKRYVGCLNKLNIVNDTLEKLGTSKNYMQFRMQIKWLIIGWFVSTFLVSAIDSLWVVRRVSVSWIIWAIYSAITLNYPLQIITLYDMMFMILLRYIGFRFDYINQHIEELTKQKKRQVRHSWTTSTSSLIHRHMAGTEITKRMIWIFMHVHLELCSISRELNTIFGFQMVMQTILVQFFTIQLAAQFYDTLMMISAHTTYEMVIDTFVLITWAISSIAKIVFFNYICEEICVKANKTETFINRLTNLTFDVETQENITQFLLQLLQKPLKMSGLGLYCFGYKFLQWIIRDAASLVIIVIQSHP